MKLAKLSLAAMVVAGLATSSFAADTLADAFAKGKVSGELRAWYFDRDFAKNPATAAAYTAATKQDADIFNTGLVLGYVTDSFMGFSMGATMQSSFAPFADKDAKADFNSDMYGSGAVLSEAYVAYTMKNTAVKVGRQFITTPLVAGSGSRMIKQSFEAALITNTDIPNTTLAAGVVTKYQNRTDGAGNVAKFNELTANHDYAYTILAINKSIPGVTLTGQWAQIENTLDDYYVEAAYAGTAAGFTYGLAANYLATSYDVSTAAGDKGTMYGAKVSMGMGNLNGYVAYSVIDDERDITLGLGGGAQPLFAKGYQYTASTAKADSKSMSLDLNYNFKEIGLLTGARYTTVDFDANPAASDEAAYLDLYAIYSFSGALKGLSADLSYENMSKDLDGKEVWFKANYKF